MYVHDGLRAWTYATLCALQSLTCNPMLIQVQKTAAALAGSGFAAPRTMECLLREYEARAAGQALRHAGHLQAYYDGSCST